ncbi:MAG: N-acetyl-gamma-glutamyl-phosphate reductase [Myxococcales bacterium]|nr:N-acetyl-gamma-glutamyl-phosphate reductase [Myxococcales bacterium]
MDAPKRTVALVGASGYTGTEALRLLLGHPFVDLRILCAGRQAGRLISEITPAFSGVELPRMVKFDADLIAAECEFAFLGLPHGMAQDATAQLLERGVRVIDLSADHRFSDPELYASIYSPHQHPESLRKTVYGLPELHRERIPQAQLVGCPGCYPTSVILGAFPAFQADLIRDSELIADCKSGVSGAGRTPSAVTHFPETADGLHAYKTLQHRHAPEMSHYLGGPTVRFVPHLVPTIRGILSTLYLRLRAGVTAVDVRRVYESAYGAEAFICVLGEGQNPDPRHVRGTNRCHIGLFQSDDLLVVQSAIDNLCKGSSGQALQCFNLMAGYDESLGLAATALFP